MANEPTVRIKVTRGFLYNGQAQKKDAVLEVPRQLAAELISMNKAERMKDAPPKPVAPKEEAK